MKKGKRCKPTNKIILCLNLIIIVSLTIVFTKLLTNNEKNNNDSLLYNIMNDNSEPNASIKTERMIQLEELQKVNSDIVGWIEIEDTNINYPILQGTDNDYYMTHDYKKEYTREGSIFLDKNYNWEKPSENILVYGHNNIGSNEMFAGLMDYKDEEFYKTHKTIRLTTNKEDVEYEIIAVFLSRVYYKSEKDVFRYYFFIDANNQEEFDYYVENSKSASLYNIEPTAEYGDQLLTLSTCEYSQEDGRLAVVARKKK